MSTIHPQKMIEVVYRYLGYYDDGVSLSAAIESLTTNSSVEAVSTAILDLLSSGRLELTADRRLRIVPREVNLKGYCMQCGKAMPETVVYCSPFCEQARAAHSPPVVGDGELRPSPSRDGRTTMGPAKTRLVEQINDLKSDWDEIGFDDTFGEYLVDNLRLQAQVESYAMPDSTRRRWVTPWEDG